MCSASTGFEKPLAPRSYSSFLSIVALLKSVRVKLARISNIRAVTFQFLNPNVRLSTCPHHTFMP